MSDSVKKYFEDNPPVGHFGSNAKEFCSKSIEAHLNEQKLLDIDQALKEYEGNVVDKWQLINRIEEIMSR